MAKKAPREGVLVPGHTVGKAGTKSVGSPAVVQALTIAQEQMGPVRAPKALAENQVRAFDWPGCVFPEPEKRSPEVFCESGATARISC